MKDRSNYMNSGTKTWFNGTAEISRRSHIQDQAMAFCSEKKKIDEKKDRSKIMYCKIKVK